MKRWVFFSWQSDLSNGRHRGLIQEALERATRAIRSDGSVEVEPVVDRDTSGVPGTPDIAATIFAKIDRAHVFVADVSITNPGGAARPAPNPNVLIELGYAVARRGWDRILLVMNTATGGPELLPFDLRGKRTLTYRAPAADPPAEPRGQLTGQLEAALRAIFAELDKQEVDDLVLRLAGEIVQEATGDYARAAIPQTAIWVQQAVEKAQEYALTPDQVEEGLEVLARKGYFVPKQFSRGMTYTFTVWGFAQYAIKHVQSYSQLLDDVAVQVVTHGLREATAIRKVVGRPPALVEQALAYLEDRRLIEVIRMMGSGDGGLQGIQVATVSAELRRLVREAGE